MYTRAQLVSRLRWASILSLIVILVASLVPFQARAQKNEDPSFVADFSAAVDEQAVVADRTDHGEDPHRLQFTIRNGTQLFFGISTQLSSSSVQVKPTDPDHQPENAFYVDQGLLPPTSALPINLDLSYQFHDLNFTATFAAPHQSAIITLNPFSTQAIMFDVIGFISSIIGGNGSDVYYGLQDPETVQNFLLYGDAYTDLQDAVRQFARLIQDAGQHPSVSELWQDGSGVVQALIKLIIDAAAKPTPLDRMLFLYFGGTLGLGSIDAALASWAKRLATGAEEVLLGVTLAEWLIEAGVAFINALLHNTPTIYLRSVVPPGSPGGAPSGTPSSTPGGGSVGGPPSSTGSAACDTTAPPLLLSPPDSTSWPQSQDVTLYWVTYCPSSYVELSGAPYGTLTFGGWMGARSLHIGTMWPGTYTWHVRVSDGLGHQSPWSQTWSFSIGNATSPPTSCNAGSDGVTLYTDANYDGSCYTFGLGEYPDLSQYGLDQMVSSLRDANSAYHITLFDQKGLAGTPAYYDGDTSSLSGYWNDRARSMRVEKHGPTGCSPGADGIIAYANSNPDSACLFIRGDIPDLTPRNWDHAINVLRFVGSYRNTKQLLVYRQANYQDFCGSYWQDQSDIRPCGGQIVSVQVRPFTPPTPIPTSPGTMYAGNIAPQAALTPGGTGAVVDGDLNTEWVGGHGYSSAITLAWPGPPQPIIHRIVVWDRSSTSSDPNGINLLRIDFSDGTSIPSIDMISGGPRCVDITFPDRPVSWVRVYPWDSSGNNGYKEVEVWATSGPQYSSNTCVNKQNYNVTPPPTPTPLPSPVPTPTPDPGVTPTPSTSPYPNLVVSTVASESSDGLSHDASNPYHIPVGVQYNNVTIMSGAYASVPGWDGNSGGTVRFTAAGTVEIDGTLSVNAKGYRGGPPLPGAGGGHQGESYTGYGTNAITANGGGGGGGDTADSGGAGGGYGTPGGNESAVVLGGNPYGDPTLSTLYLGSGGGSSGAQSGQMGASGGDGGGAIAISANSIVVTGVISANGDNGASVPNNPGNWRGGGGGSGGSIFLHANTLTLGTNLVTATGGQGGYGIWDNQRDISGANGGDGRIRIEYHQSMSGSTSPAATIAQV